MICADPGRFFSFRGNLRNLREIKRCPADFADRRRYFGSFHFLCPDFSRGVFSEK
jgi:hypothetical protein